MLIPQIPDSESPTAPPKLSTYSSMCLFTKDPIFFKRDDTRPIHILLHRFIAQLVVGRGDAIVALELGDTVVREQFVKMGESGCCPPWPKVHDIMYCRLNWEVPMKVKLVVIRGVILPCHLRDGDTSASTSEDMDDVDDYEPYTGQVLVSELKLCNRERREYKASTNTTQCSWTCLLGHVNVSGSIMTYDIATHVPTRWVGIEVVDNYKRGILRY